MNKKILAIIAIAILGLGIIGSVVLGNKDDSSDTAQNKSTDTSDVAKSDNSKDEDDLGLCDLVETDVIKSSIGSTADNLTGPNNTGVTGLGDGDKGQTCVYPFVSGGSVTNSFYTDLAVYSQETFKLVSDFTANGNITVSGLGDRASFEASESTVINTTEFSLTVVQGTKVYKFVISQPEAEVTISATDAQTALTAIAMSANL